MITNNGFVHNFTLNKYQGVPFPNMKHMDQVSIFNQLNDSLDHHKVINLHFEWLFGKSENILFEPYLLGDNHVSNWTFIYGKDNGKNHLMHVPVPFIVSVVEETDESFVGSEKDKCFLVFDFEKNRIKKASRRSKLLIFLSQMKLKMKKMMNITDPNVPFVTKNMIANI